VPCGAASRTACRATRIPCNPARRSSGVAPDCAWSSLKGRNPDWAPCRHLKGVGEQTVDHMIDGLPAGPLQTESGFRPILFQDLQNRVNSANRQIAQLFGSHRSILNHSNGSGRGAPSLCWIGGASNQPRYRRRTCGGDRRINRSRARQHLAWLAMAVTCACCSTSVDWWVRLRSHPDLPICHSCLGGLNGQRDGQLQLLTSTWLITGFEPVFNVASVTRSAGWYERAGFQVSLHSDTYAFAHRDQDLTIHLAQASADDPPGHGGLYIYCLDADRVAEDWSQAGIAVEGPLDEDYGRREGSVRDPDGNVIRFGSRIR
jgi:hypothetical protein